MEEELKQLDRAKSFLILADSEAGKNIIETLADKYNGILESILVGYKTLSHIDLLNLLSRLDVVRGFLQEFDEAKEKVEVLTNELKIYENNKNNKED
jgi:hypothetical protein